MNIISQWARHHDAKTVQTIARFPAIAKLFKKTSIEKCRINTLEVIRGTLIVNCDEAIAQDIWRLEKLIEKQAGLGLFIVTRFGDKDRDPARIYANNSDWCESLEDLPSIPPNYASPAPLAAQWLILGDVDSFRSIASNRRLLIALRKVDPRTVKKAYYEGDRLVLVLRSKAAAMDLAESLDEETFRGLPTIQLVVRDKVEFCLDSL